MPSTIPYDPSLVLGNLVSQEALDNLTAISAIQAPIDAAEDTMNSYIEMKRSIDMTIQELIDMNIDVTDLTQQSTDVGKSIQEAAVEYAKTKVEGLAKIQPLKAKIKGVHDEIESPIDYNKSKTITMPLSADSLKMNVQYFSFDENDQDSSTQASAVKGFVSEEVAGFGKSVQSQASSSAQSQMNSQYQRHDIAGTLVISITCTHKMAMLLAPLILDVDKAIRVWNKVYKDEIMDPTNPDSMAAIISQPEQGDEKSLTLLSGATYGSCFIGMVHILNTTTTRSSETMYSMAESMQLQFKVSAFVSNAAGGFGLDSSFSNDAKNLLSTQSISSHCSLVTMGLIPSIKSNSVKMGVQQFKPDDAGPMNQLAQLQTATASDDDTVNSAAEKARTGQQMMSIKNSQVQGMLASLATIDDGANKIIDINSMMDGMDDYIQQALKGNIGVPINYYLKPITKKQLAEMWVAKYYPGKFLTIGGDDSTPPSGQSAQAQGNANAGQ
ncbi:hypothetical protein [Mucilaginibacter jinjuensis]|uniref:Uncharacterized protein n=1 Tax=Mucilaginibacter jinjuensis TaxID=1176721 RepID=A0ABY7TDZ2_9SPHI|nr:hypothetical protein [Mucilaginibacter jinjuensis]WCT14413.1 hypothetical protein PQO05_10765 [Mucilaginibacter jinjuensis]